MSLANKLSIDSITEKRWNHNCTFFTIGFFFIGIVTGVSMDAFISFLQLKAPAVTSAYSSYLGLAMLIAGLMIFLIPKFGYKKILLPFPLLIVGSLLGLMYLNNQGLTPILTILFLLGCNVAPFVLAPMLSSYTTLDNRTKIFARALYANVIGTAVATLFDGNLVIYFFSKFLHISYAQANMISRHPKLLTSAERISYFNAFKSLLWIVCLVAVCAFVITLFLKENKEDYVEQQDSKAEKHKKINWSILKQSNVLVWLLFTTILSFGVSLIVPYLPIYLNEFLHIGRGTISTILAFQYVASVIFMLLIPKFEKIFGSVISLVILFLASVPMFILIVNGKMFGNEVIFAIGILLFFRSGLANGCNPIMQALPMSFVKKSDRATVNAAVSVMQAVGYILGGLFAKYVLFIKPSGYSTAYYIAAILYALGTIMMALFLFKKYNRYTEKFTETISE
ncbi:MAG: MFS transporter [Sarcina sp.]